MEAMVLASSVMKARNSDRLARPPRTDSYRIRGSEILSIVVTVGGTGVFAVVLDLVG